MVTTHESPTASTSPWSLWIRTFEQGTSEDDTAYASRLVAYSHGQRKAPSLAQRLRWSGEISVCLALVLTQYAELRAHAGHSPSLHAFHFTFGHDHRDAHNLPLHNKFVTVHAPNEQTAHNILCACRDHRWHACYRGRTIDAQIRQFSLTETDLFSVTLPPTTLI